MTKATEPQTTNEAVCRPTKGRSVDALPPRAPPADFALIRRLRDGDEAAFADLIQQYHGRLSGLARVFISDRAAAEEVVQETWLEVLNGLGDFDGRCTVETWIFRILVNRAKTRGVREGRKGQEPAPAPASTWFRADGQWAQPPRRWDDDTPAKLMPLLTRAIDTLPSNQRAVVMLRDVEGLQSEEICDLLQISDADHRVLLHRGRSNLRQQLAEHFEVGWRCT